MKTGDQSVFDFILLKKSIFRFMLFHFFSVITIGIVAIIFYWFEDLYVYLYKEEKDKQFADHILIISSETGKKEIVKLFHSDSLFFPLHQQKFRHFFHFKHHFYYFGKERIKVLENVMLKKIKKDPGVVMKLWNGISQKNRENLLKTYKKNAIDIKTDSIGALLIEEIFSPYTIFQLFAIFTWAIDTYQLYAGVILFMMIITISMTVYENYTQAQRMRKMTYINEPVFISKHENREDSKEMIKSESSLREIDSVELVIGDVVKIEQGKPVYADILIVKGKCLMNEAMLTGETVPILKRQYDLKKEPEGVNIVYAGTECILAKETYGIVISTGFYTKKGEIIRTLLFTEHQQFKFKTDAFKMLFIIFIIVTISYIVLMIYIYDTEYKEFYDAWFVFIRGTELLTTAVPPILPLAITIGLEIASQRLKKKEVFTLFLDKINQAGKVRLCCFDKTGTLTENSLQFRGLLPIYSASDSWDLMISESEAKEEFVTFGNFYLNMNAFENDSSLSKENKNFLIYECMACCHSLEKIKDKLIGDPIEVQLFKQTNFIFERDETTDELLIRPDDFFIHKMKVKKDRVYKIEHTFDFNSDRKRMSTVVSVEGQKRLFVKGAPEVIKKMCFSQNLPLDYDEQLRDFTEQGYRVLAMAYKDVDNEEEIDVSLEYGVQFIGFVIFENPLKPESKHTVETLKDCDVRSVIITGDNLLTALSVGISLNLFHFNKRVFIAEMQNNKVEWEEIENEQNRRNRLSSLHSDDHSLIMSRKNSTRSVMTNLNDHNTLYSTVIKEAYKDNSVICITGEAFDFIFDDIDLKKKTYQKLLNNIYIYARTSPHQKAKIVQRYKEYQKLVYKSEWFVCFCGDGANDSEALKVADVGMSLSSSEALLAATFNTTKGNISCLIDLFIQAKCSLETSLQNAKYVLYYSLLQFIALMLAYLKALEYNNMNYFFWDLFIFFPLSIFINNTKAQDKLNKFFPETSLLNMELSISLFGQFLISSLFAILIYFIGFAQDSALEIFYIFVKGENEWFEPFYREIVSLFYFVSIMNCWGAVIFGRGYPFKQSVWTNFWVIFWVILFTALVTFIVFAQYLDVSYGLNYLINSQLRIPRQDFSFTCNFVLITVICIVVSFFIERNIFSKWAKQTKGLELKL